MTNNKTTLTLKITPFACFATSNSTLSQENVKHKWDNLSTNDKKRFELQAKVLTEVAKSMKQLLSASTKITSNSECDLTVDEVIAFQKALKSVCN